MCIDSYADISIHTPTRGTTAGTGTATNLAEFQSTFPREERPYYTIVRIQVLQFQSTLPREERLLELALILIACVFQSTLPREERLTDANVQLYAKSISIHAPTRGATLAVEFFQVRQSENFNPRSHERSDKHQRLIFTQDHISIHAPTRGAT